MIMEPLKVDWNQELRKSVLKGKLEEMDIAIAYGANINHIYKGGWTLPHFCARNNQLEALKQIVLRGGKLGAQKQHYLPNSIPDCNPATIISTILLYPPSLSLSLYPRP